MKNYRLINRNRNKPVSEYGTAPALDINNNGLTGGSRNIIGEIKIGEKWVLHGCPRCEGDVFLDIEEGEILGHCLQCGFVGLTQKSRI
jgi:hypothetical protein